MKDGKDDMATATGAVKLAAWIVLSLAIMLAALVWWQFPKEHAARSRAAAIGTVALGPTY